MTPLEAIEYLHQMMELRANTNGPERDKCRQAAQVIVQALNPPKPEMDKKKGK